MSLFLSQRRLHRLLSAVELFLVVACALVLADVAFTLRALNETARRQQEQSGLAANQDTTGRRFALARRAVGPAPLPVAHALRQPVGFNSPALLSAAQEEPAAQKAHRLQIPAIGVDSLVYQGWDEHTLRLGVGLRPGSPAPGEAGNLLLSAHNDVHGAIFRHLDRLEPGDAIYISTENVLYTYVVRDVRIVSPDSIWVTLPTAQATATLISCYPYLFDTQRIVVFADFAG